MTQQAEHITVREYYERTKREVIGAPSSLAPMRERIYSFVFDGKAFGDHYVDEPKYAECDMLANVLAWCAEDGEIVGIDSLVERKGTQTPDFEARLNDGRTVRIEVTQFADRKVRAYVGDLNEVFNRVQAARAEDAALAAHIAGMHFVFRFPADTPHGADRAKAAGEVLRTVRSVDKNALRPTTWYRPPTDCTVLVSHGVTWGVSATGKPDTRVQFRPSLTLPTSGGMIDAAADVLSHKRSKHAGYSDGGAVEVWLAVFVSDGVSPVGLTAIKEMARRAASVDPLPFARLMIGNHVAGLLIPAEGGAPAVYRSVSERRREIPR